ncbi:MAG: carbohydrate ABC transporter permease [Candidatus Aerophobetes bacterium]|nr:carbohydrate ABC transporter permease [Candidatus Aerophobetes bacterium]
MRVKIPRPSRIILYILLALFTILILLPLWTCVVTALKTSKEVILTTPVTPPLYPTLAPLIESLDYLKRPLMNSLVLVGSGVMVSCFFGSILGYVFSKRKFRGSIILFILVILCLYTPPQVQLIPMVRVTSNLGLHGNLGSLVLLYMLFGIPMCAFIFKTLYDEIPDSFINAAKVDGAGTWTIYRRIILPLSVIPFVVAALLQVVIIWNDFIWGLVLTSGKANLPVTVAMANLKGSFVAEWNLQMAGALWIALPTLIIFIFLGKYIIRGYSGM